MINYYVFSMQLSIIIIVLTIYFPFSKVAVMMFNNCVKNLIPWNTALCKYNSMHSYRVFLCLVAGPISVMFL